MAIGGYVRGVSRAGWVTVLTLIFMAVVPSPQVSAGPVPLTQVGSRIPVDLTSLGQAQAVSWSRPVPRFPIAIPGYSLKGKAEQTETRIFKGGKWEALSPLDQSLAGRCDSWIWIVRWRSRNPEVTVKSALIDTAVPPPYSSVGRSSTGGAGYIWGNACLSPGLKFASAVNGNGSNLVDIDYEYQVWLPKRKI